MSEYIKRFWIGIDGSVAKVPDDETHIDFVMGRTGAFGLSDDDINLYKENPLEVDRLQGMLDGTLAKGCGSIPGTDAHDSMKDLPAISFTITSKNLVHPNKPGMLTIIFHRESYPMNDRMVKFIRDKFNGPEGITGDMDVLMIENGSSRKWTQTVQSFKDGYQFAKDPSKGVTCVRCGQPISRDELIGTMKCPRCALMLA